MNTSEVAKLREQIELECQALQHLMLFSAVASHDSIKQRYKNLDRYHEQLKALVGAEEAIDMLADIYKQWVK
jgi:hypothetical protein